MVKRVFVSLSFLVLLSIVPIGKNYGRSSHRHGRRYSVPTIIDTTDYSKNIWGIDLSHHQGTINWDLIDRSEKPHFIFFKVTEGTTITDSKYSQHLENARKLNIPCGAYHFFSYQSDGKSQAKHFIKNARLQKGDLHPVLDVEVTRRTRRARMNITKEIKAFCTEIYKTFKVYPIIYCNERFYEKYLKVACKDFNFWICDYRKQPRINWVFWQHTDKGKVNGINGTVDRNRLNPKKKIDNYLL
jgi:lysozyme